MQLLLFFFLSEYLLSNSSGNNNKNERKIMKKLKYHRAFEDQIRETRVRNLKTNQKTFQKLMCVYLFRLTWKFYSAASFEKKKRVTF
jgi:hypothetical protein